VTARRLAHRTDALWLAALVHRLSGIGLAVFLPFHFLALGLALRGEAALDGFLRWTDRPLVKLAEGVLVFLLAVHLLGGLRLLWIETMAWREGQARLAAAAAIVAALTGLAFLAWVS
jgi:fumarate reductase subunit D